MGVSEAGARKEEGILTHEKKHGHSFKLKKWIYQSKSMVNSDSDLVKIGIKLEPFFGFSVFRLQCGMVIMWYGNN